jgi:hypothetical protein
VSLSAAFEPKERRLHFPDLVIEGPGPRTAVELELTPKGSRRLRGILSAYGWECGYDAVVYYVGTPKVGEQVTMEASRLGLDGRIKVEPWAAS